MPPNDFEKDHPYYEAMVLLSEGLPEAALGLLEAGDPKWHPGAYEATLADVYLALDRTSESGTRAQRAMELGWDTPRVRTIFGHALWRAGLRHEAVEQYERAGDESALATLALGWAAYNAGDFSSAERHAARVLELDPESEAARPILLAAQAAQGNPVARKDLRELWTESGQAEAIEYVIKDARRRKALPELDDFLPGFRQAVAHNNRLATMVMQLLVQRQSPAEGLRLYHELPEDLRETPILLEMAGWALAKEGRHQESVRLYERAFEAEPTNESFARSLASAYNRLRRYGAALKVCFRNAKATIEYEKALEAEKKVARSRTEKA